MRDVGGLHAGDVLVSKQDRPAPRLPQTHDGAQCGGLARAVAPQDHMYAAFGYVEADPVQDLILGDVGVNILQPKDRGHHATSSAPTPR